MQAQRHMLALAVQHEEHVFASQYQESPMHALEMHRHADASAHFLFPNLLQPAFSVLHTLAQVNSCCLCCDQHMVSTHVQHKSAFLSCLTHNVPTPHTGFEINTDLWVWHAIKWVEFANPLTSDVCNHGVVSEACTRFSCCSGHTKLLLRLSATVPLVSSIAVYTAHGDHCWHNNRSSC
eukprot:1157484-Pelagomonas_calceolata.AAC.1